MIARIRQRWVEFWFEPAAKTQFTATRVIVALYALWLVLSRPMLWAVTSWPAPIVPKRYPDLLIRFGLYVLPPGVEEVLYRALPILLTLVVLGIAVRFSALFAALLLYHFAPLEEFFAGIFSNGHSGFAFAVLSLLIIAFAPSTDRNPSEDYRWPVALIQLLVALQYFLGGLSKLRFTGITWYTGQNIAATADEMASLTGAPWGHFIAQSLPLAWAIAMATFALEFMFPLALVSRRARWILLPVALVAHFIRTRVYGFYFIGWPLLALFVNWEWVLERLLVRRSVMRGPQSRTTDRVSF